MFLNRFEILGRGACGWLLFAASAGCGGSTEPSAPAIPASPAAVPAAAPSEPAAVASRESPAAEQPVPQAPAPKPASSAAPPLAAVPKPPQIPLGELLVRRDLWPPKVALTKPLTIERGVTLPVGHELSVYEFNGGDIALDTGSDIFECPADQTDVIERASALKARLTPEQLALDDNTLPQHPELWPLKVSVTRRMQFQNGQQLPVGREVSVRSVTIGWANLYDSEMADFFPAEAFETDLIARARERLALPEEQREPFFVRSIAAALEPSSTAADPQLKQADYLLVYRARLGCTRCAAFAPELADFYERVKSEHPGFETVFYSEDKTAEDAQTVFATEKFPGRAIRYDQRLAAADLASQSGELLPLVYLYDRSGKLITANNPAGGKPSAADILAVLETKLAQR